MRELLFGPAARPELTGQAVWRATVPRPPEVRARYSFYGPRNKCGFNRWQMPSALAQTDDAAALAGVVCDPVRFCNGLLRQDLWPLQESILRSVASRPRIAVKACHASGKTFVAAVAVLWFVTRYRDGIVVTTAPTWTQVEKLLWGEIHRAVQSSRIAFPELNKPSCGSGQGTTRLASRLTRACDFKASTGAFSSSSTRRPA
jgi:hypothetical protein